MIDSRNLPFDPPPLTELTAPNLPGVQLSARERQLLEEMEREKAQSSTVGPRAKRPSRSELKPLREQTQRRARASSARSNVKPSLKNDLVRRGMDESKAETLAIRLSEVEFGPGDEIVFEDLTDMSFEELSANWQDREWFDAQSARVRWAATYVIARKYVDMTWDEFLESYDALDGLFDALGIDPEDIPSTI